MLGPLAITEVAPICSPRSATRPAFSTRLMIEAASSTGLVESAMSCTPAAETESTVWKTAVGEEPGPALGSADGEPTLSQTDTRNGPTTGPAKTPGG